MNEIAEQMLRTQLHIIALQEIRWKGHGQIKKNTYSLYYICSEQTTGNPISKDQRHTGGMTLEKIYGR